MDAIQYGIGWVMDLIEENPTQWWFLIALPCLGLVWLVGRSASVDRFR